MPGEQADDGGPDGQREQQDEHHQEPEPAADGDGGAGWTAGGPGVAPATGEEHHHDRTGDRRRHSGGHGHGFVRTEHRPDEDVRHDHDEGADETGGRDQDGVPVQCRDDPAEKAYQHWGAEPDEADRPRQRHRC